MAAGVFKYPDGRLKTGRVALAVFLVVLAGLGLIFKLNRPLDKATLAVKHVFEARAVEERPKKQTEKKTPAARAVENRQAAKTSTAGSEKRSEAVSRRSAAEKSKPSKPAPAAEKQASNPKKNAPKHAEQPAQKEKKQANTVLKAKKTGVEAQKAVSEKNDATRIAAPEALDSLKKAAEDSGPSKPEPAVPLDISKKLASLTESRDTSKAAEKADSKGFAAPLPEPGGAGLTVDGATYEKLFHSWREAGRGEAPDAGLIPLRVENLRSAYELFQMKPVAVVGQGTYIDLLDGTRLAEAGLEEYSGTVFHVERPWSKWGPSLQSAGIRRADQLEVRYYMYDFIRAAIYARVNRAFECCRQKGLLGPQVKPGEVDVLGRAYVIEKRGGGRFGVFVPVLVDTQSGRSITVDPACLDGQADIRALRQAGLI